VVTCCGLFFALFHYHKKHHTIFLIALTICLGFSLLIKGTTIFIFPVLFFYYLFKKDLPLPKLKVLTILTFIPLLMAGAWSAYPSKVTGKFVFLNLAHKNTLAKGHGFDMEFKAGLTTKPYTPMEVEHKILGKYLSAPSQFIHRCHEKIKRIITYYHFFFVGLMAYPMISFTRKSTKWYMASLLLIIIIAAQYSSVKMSILYLGCGFLSLISLANTTFTRNHLNTKKTTPLTISTLYAFALFLSLVIVFYPSRRYLAPYAPLMVWPICLWAETIFFNSLQVMKTIIQQKNVLS
jgi:4-amino-4-deoxy-L-arabinose transferase-like glycosyltransferase